MVAALIAATLPVQAQVHPERAATGEFLYGSPVRVAPWGSEPPVSTAPRVDVDFEALLVPQSLLTAPPATFEEQVVEIVNQRRLDCAVSGCPKPPLKLQANLFSAAFEHSESMAQHDYFSHVDFFAGCADPFERIAATGYWPYEVAGENIAAGYETPADVMSAWMSSLGHRSNILGDCESIHPELHCPYRELGVGYYFQSGDQENIDRDCNGDCDCVDATACGGNPETCSAGPYLRYWTQTFGARAGSTGYPVVIDREAYATATAIVDLYVYQPPGSGAQMRFANETGDFTPFEAFTTDVTNWQLTAGDGRKAVIAEVTTSQGTFRTCDRIWLDGSGDTSFLFAEGFECDGFAAWSDVVGGI